MLEPLATIVVNSILSSSRSTHRPLYSVARTVELHPARTVLAQDFFTPHPRPTKGKEKAVDSSPEHLHPNNASSGVECIMTNPPSCSRRNRVFVTNSRRDRPSRRRLSPYISHLSHRRSFQPHGTAPLISYSRQTSTVAVSSLLNTPVEHGALRTVLLSSDMPVNQLNLEQAWQAYTTVVASGAVSSLNPAQLLAFADKLVSGAERLYRLDDVSSDTLHRWGHRLSQLLDVVHSDAIAGNAKGGHISRHDHRLRCLHARVHAIAGNIDQAMAMARDLVNANFRVGLYAIVKTIIHSSKRNVDPFRTLEIVVTEWPVFEPFVSNLPSLYAILASIRDPVSILAARRDWDKESKARAGELLIRALCRHKLPKDALAVFDEMGRQRLTVPDELQLVMVRALGQANVFGPANRVFAGLPSTVPLGARLSTGLHLFSQQGDVARTEACYAQLEAESGRVSSSQQALRMYAYAVLGKTEQVVSLFHQLFPSSSDPNQALPKSARSVHYEILVFAHARAGDVNGMNVWLRNMAQAGYPPSIYVYNNVLKSFAAHGEVELVSATLDQMRTSGVKPNHVSYTIVITLLAHRQDPVSAEAIYRRALREGVVPDRRMITALMNAHVEGGSWKGVVRVFDYLASTPIRHIRPSIETYNTLLKAYVLIGAPFKLVSRFFVRLEKVQVRPDEYTFALLIQSACDSGDMEAASEVLAEMERRVEEGQIPGLTAHVLTNMMSGFLRIGDQDRAKAIYDQMRELGIEPTPITFRTLLKAYGKEGAEESLQIAEEIIQSLVNVETDRRAWDKPTDTRVSALEHVYRPLMTAYARQARLEDVERLLRDVLSAGGEPTLGLLTALLDAYRRSGNVDGVLRVWPQLFHLALRFSRAKYFFDSGKEGEADRWHNRHQSNTMCAALSIYIDALSAAGLHSRIGKTWMKLQTHGFGFDAHNWNHLAVALVRAEEPERAFEVVEKVILRYRGRGAQVEEGRITRPDSPLSFGDAQSLENEEGIVPELHVEALRRTAERAWAVRLSTREVDSWSEDLEKSIGAGDDFAQALHVLHQIAPSWSVWSPHDRTLRALLTVIWRLESGVAPKKSRGEFDQGQDRDDRYGTGPTARDEKEEAQNQQTTEIARAILGRIYRDCPQTVRTVLNFELRERRRLGKRFDGMYR